MSSRTVSNVASEILVRDSTRKSLLIINEDATDIVYLKQERSENTTVSSTDHDVKLGPGSGFSLGSLNDGKAQIIGRWSAIASANTPRLGIFESRDSDG